jgi:NCAIR mutase (PurE)-related protein
MLNESTIRSLLSAVARNERSIDDALASLRTLPFEEVDGFAKIDHHRPLRRGFPEVVYCAGKTPQQVAQIVQRMAAHSARVLGTHATTEHFEATTALIPEATYNATARCLWVDREPQRQRTAGTAIIAAGTSDLPVADEAAVTLDLLGFSADRINDVGVAGLQRLLAHQSRLSAARVVIVVAGMEGALPSVVAGLVSAPVVAVPTSVGYGANFGGLAALLGMLNSCSPGIGVVNIDNGFGAAYLAASILQIHG